EPRHVANPYAARLSDAAARETFNTMVRGLPAEGTARQLVDIALNNPELRVVMIDGRDSSNHYAQARAVAGFSSNDRNEIYVATRYEDRVDLLMEEAMHNGIRNIYNNNSRPYGSDADPRRALLNEAFRADLERNGRSMAQMRRDLGLEGYRGSEFAVEALVKL